ncbi:MAG: hypothetical protein ABFC34_13145, partial [Methanobacterium sp.]
MNQINNNETDRNRGIEVLLYKGEDEKKKEEPIAYKFCLNKIFSLFNRECSFKVEFVARHKNNSREA